MLLLSPQVRMLRKEPIQPKKVIMMRLLRPLKSPQPQQTFMTLFQSDSKLRSPFKLNPRFFELIDSMSTKEDLQSSPRTILSVWIEKTIFLNNAIHSELESVRIQMEIFRFKCICSGSFNCIVLFQFQWNKILPWFEFYTYCVLDQNL